MVSSISPPWSDEPERVSDWQTLELTNLPYFLKLIVPRQNALPGKSLLSLTTGWCQPPYRQTSQPEACTTRRGHVWLGRRAENGKTLSTCAACTQSPKRFECFRCFYRANQHYRLLHDCSLLPRTTKGVQDACFHDLIIPKALWNACAACQQIQTNQCVG